MQYVYKFMNIYIYIYGPLYLSIILYLKSS